MGGLLCPPLNPKEGLSGPPGGRATRNAWEGHLSSDSDSGQEKDHGDCEEGDPHPMEGIPLSEVALHALRESIRTHSDHTVVDWHQGQ